MKESPNERLLERIQRLTTIGIALSAEKDISRLLENILIGAKELTHADGGSLYTVTSDNYLKFECMRTDSLSFVMGGTSGKQIPYDPLPLYDDQGEPNLHMVAACAVLKDKTINIPDAYADEEFDFSGTRAFDEKTGYHSRSFLTVPMKNHENEIIGVMQLINATDPDSGVVIEFTPQDQLLVQALTSQASVALTNTRLIEGQRRLFEAFIQLIAAAIDEKSPYTGGHCERVPELTMMIANAASECNTGVLKDFKMSEKDAYELHIAGWLHDCGKVTTPEYVVDKATKLETIFDRIEMIRTRVEVLKRDARIQMLEAKLNSTDNGHDAEKDYQDSISALEDDLAFIEKANIGGEFMSQEYQQRIRDIAGRVWEFNSEQQAFLSEDEIDNLNIARGTLNPEEREVINNHIVMTIKMLGSLPYPKHLKKVTEYAGGHHERMDGKGYPNGLKREDMSVQARIMGIADIFEALTAKDRPYKPGKTLTQALFILGKMREDNHIDPDIFDLFVRNKVYLTYAEKFMDPDQMDQVDENKIPGYAP
ncbi:MAG: HD family phosphohydrolase [Gammaproteobacteria bacterium]|nr:MAG: HD family phosphohydrolase [Gammaproteobacteria bacterium]